MAQTAPKQKIIIARLMGGLGNQMFQYAIARHLSLKNNCPLKLDISYFKHDPLRHFALNSFNINASLARSEELKPFYRYRGRRPQAIILGLLQELMPFSRHHYIKEKKSGFDPRLEKLTGPAYLDGYWQSEKYFIDIADTIRREFTPKKPLNAGCQKVLNSIEQNISVSVHVRRDDYLSEKLSKIFETCSPEYYANALKLINTKLANPRFFIFADDDDWAKRNLPKDINAEFVSQYKFKDFEDLILMSKCQHNIIANSSFSWWGAWLNQNPNKIVIAPKKWLNSGENEQLDIIPESWIKI